MKRLFQILDEMNVADGDHNTKNLVISPNLVSAQTAKGGGHVTMGVDAETLHTLALEPEKKIVILVVIDREVYNQKLKEVKP